nr:hypothetical protein [Tanacetum cinerariifolium]
MMFAKGRGNLTSLAYARPTSSSAAARESAEHLTNSMAGSSNMTTTVDAVLSDTSRWEVPSLSCPDGINLDSAFEEEVVEEDAGSCNVNTSPDINIKQSKRLATKPFATPSKPTKERGKKVQVDLEDSYKEVTCKDDGHADGKDSSVSDKKKKKRYSVDDSTS